jgi:hypothetical protein
MDFGVLPIILGFITEIQAEYTKLISFLEDQLELEEQAHKYTKFLLENVSYKVKTLTSNRENLQIETLLSPLPPLTKRQRKGLESIATTGPLPPKATGSTPVPPPMIPPPPPPPQAAPTPAPPASQGTWAQVVGKKKKKTTTSAKPAPAALPPTTTSTKPPTTKKGLSHRDRKLII